MTKHDLNNAETTKFILFSLCLWSRVCLGELPEEFWKQPTGKCSVNLSPFAQTGREVREAVCRLVFTGTGFLLPSSLWPLGRRLG